MKNTIIAITAIMLIAHTPTNAQIITADSTAAVEEILETDIDSTEITDMEQPEYEYFNKQSVLNIDSTDDFTGFELLQPAIRTGYRVYFTGENHTYTGSNSELQLKMFKYLHQTANVNTLFMEFGFSRGWVVNEYVQTGDTSLLTILQGYSFLEFADMYKGLMEYNKTLPDDNKIKVIGIDVERHFQLAVKAMAMNLPKKEAPAEIMLQVESLKGLATYYDAGAKKKIESEAEEKTYYNSSYSYNSANTMEDIIENFIEYDSIYRVYLDDKYELIKRIMLGLQQREKWADYDRLKMPQAYVFREQYMYKEFMDHLKANPNDNFFAQFGRCHVSIITQEEACSWYDYNSIAQRLNNSTDSAIKNKVCTIAIMYPKESMDQQSANKYPCIKAYFDAAEDSGMTIFNILNTPDSCGELYKKYNYVIVSNTSPNPTFFGPSYIDYVTRSTKSTKPHKGGALVSVGYLQRSYNFDGINKFLATLPNTPKLDEEVYGFGISIQRINKKGKSLRYSATSFRNNDISLSPTVSLDFSSYSLGVMFGKDIFKSSYFDLTPHVGLQTGNIRLKYQVDTAATAPNGSLFGEGTTIYYKNPFTAFELNMTMQYRINGKLGIGAEAGYVLDISNKAWMLDDENVGDAPEQSANGYYAGVNLVYRFGTLTKNKKPKYPGY